MRKSTPSCSPVRLAFLSCVVAWCWAGAALADVAVSVTIDPTVRQESYSGRLYVVFVEAERMRREPRASITSWFGGPTVVALDVQGVRPGERVPIEGERVLSVPTGLDAIPPGAYAVQAVARVNPDSPNPGRGAGDLYSAVERVVIAEGQPVVLSLTLDNVVEEQTFSERARVKYVELPSASLSAFHGRPMTLRAGVVLPKGWSEDAQRTWPVLYEVGGFGGTHFNALRYGRDTPEGGSGPFDDVIIVVPDPSCYRGHSVFADSANNGPWGHALVHELAPHIDERFGGAGAEHRYVWGVSSGGWSSAWLIVTYPEHFAAGFAHVPDPVDFSDFQHIDLYAPGANMYRDEAGERRPLARRGDEVTLWYEDFVRREDVAGPGGQIHSFEAVFSPRGEDGAPMPLFDRATGAVDVKVARSWEPYDIRLVLTRNWEVLGPKVAGKLHVYGGGRDNFYLGEAVLKLRDAVYSIDPDADVVIEYIPELTHSVHRPGYELMQRMIKERFESAQ